MRVSALIVVMLFVVGTVWAGDETTQTGPAPVLEKPVKIKVGEEPIDVLTGHAAPYVCDWNGDGKLDLLVGQFGGGKLRIYENVGAAARPKFEKHVLFRAEGEDATVPSG